MRLVRASPTSNEMKRRMSIALCPKSIRPAALSLAAVVCLMGCAPKAVRGGEGTSNPNLDNAAMSTGLDRVDVKDLVAKNLEAMMSSGWWSKDVQAAEDDLGRKVRLGLKNIEAVQKLMNSDRTEYLD